MHKTIKEDSIVDYLDAICCLQLIINTFCLTIEPKQHFFSTVTCSYTYRNRVHGVSYRKLRKIDERVAAIWDDTVDTFYCPTVVCMPGTIDSLHVDLGQEYGHIYIYANGAVEFLGKRGNRLYTKTSSLPYKTHYCKVSVYVATIIAHKFGINI